MSLDDYGWNSFVSDAFDSLHDPGLAPGRVVHASGSWCRLWTGEGHASVLRAPPLPETVGDWVAYQNATNRVRHVLPRRTKLVRKAAGKRTTEQIVAANVDAVLVVMGLDADFNPRRLERLLTLAWDSGAMPVVVLNKADRVADAEARRTMIEAVSPGVRVVVSSTVQEQGCSEIEAQLLSRATHVLVGSSGVGKSTIVNRLLGREARATREVRSADGRGRHTTTDRELVRLPGGALLIDGPGMREVGLWAGEESLDRTFGDVLELAARCRFRDCSHASEPGCAVLAAVEEGELDAKRLRSFQGLQKELRHLQTRQDASARLVEKQKWRAIHREMRRTGRHRRT